MPLLQYETQIAEDGSITLPRLPEYRKIVVIVQDGELEGQDWQAVFDDFMSSWQGCAKGVPHTLVEEFRAERLEKEGVFWPNPTDEQLDKMYEVCRGCLEGMTEEEYDHMREERILGKR